MSKKNQKSALISVFNKDGIDNIAKKLKELNVNIISTGGTEKYLNEIGIKTEKVEKLTDYPSIFGGRVKTLHPKIFGGILYRRHSNDDNDEKDKFDIPKIDFIIVDLYPFEDTVNDSKSHEEIIEKIDIGGISLIRAAAKNYNDVVCVSSTHQYGKFIKDLNQNKGDFSLEQKKDYALNAFLVSSNYDTLISEYFEMGKLRIKKPLRYGENPHQKGYFLGNLDDVFDKLNGKELSYNNLLDIDSAVNIIAEFWNNKPTFAILKHNNACGLSTRENIYDAYEAALEGDPVSAFGGVLISNSNIDLKTSEKINNLFFEVILAPSFDNSAINILKSKKIPTESGLLKNETKKLYKNYNYVRKNKMPYVTGKLACSSNFYILKNNEPITNEHSRKVSHLLRYYNQGILTSYKTINSDNPKLNCRINGLERFSPTRIIIDKDLKLKINSFIVNSSIKYNTIIFHSSSNKKKINYLKNKKIKLIYVDLNKYGYMDLKFIFKKIYEKGIHNILVECGIKLINKILKENLFNEFYLFKSNNKIFKKNRLNAKSINKSLKTTFKNKEKINTYLDKDKLMHYY